MTVYRNTNRWHTNFNHTVNAPFVIDFRALNAGTPLSASVIPRGGTLTRDLGAGNSGDTVQVATLGPRPMVSGISASIPRIGAGTAPWPGLTIEHRDTNTQPASRDMNYTTGGSWQAGGESVFSPGYESGPDGLSGSAGRMIIGPGTYGRVAKTEVSITGDRSWTIWCKAVGTGSRASTAMTTPTPLVAKGTTTLTTTSWERLFITTTVSSSNLYAVSSHAGDLISVGGLGNGAQDLVCDCFQKTNSHVPHEFIPTAASSGATAVSNADKVMYPLRNLVKDGRLSLDMLFTPKAARTDYSGSIYLWYVDGNNYASIDANNGFLTCSIGGSAWKPTVPIDNWRAEEPLEFFIAAGNGTPKCRYRKYTNGSWGLPFDPAGGMTGSVQSSFATVDTRNTYSEDLTNVAWDGLTANYNRTAGQSGHYSATSATKLEVTNASAYLYGVIWAWSDPMVREGRKLTFGAWLWTDTPGKMIGLIISGADGGVELDANSTMTVALTSSPVYYEVYGIVPAVAPSGVIPGFDNRSIRGGDDVASGSIFVDGAHVYCGSPVGSDRYYVKSTTAPVGNAQNISFLSDGNAAGVLTSWLHKIEAFPANGMPIWSTQWLPTDYANTVFYARDDGLITPSGSNISAWGDQSLNRHNLEQQTGSKQPFISSSMVYFDTAVYGRTLDFVEPWAQALPITIYATFKNNNIAGTGYSALVARAGSTGPIVYAPLAGAPQVRTLGVYWNGSQATGSAQMPVNQFCRLRTRITGSISSARIDLGTEFVFTHASPGALANWTSVSSAAGDQYLSGTLRDLIIIQGSDVSDIDDEKFMNYMKVKNGL
jgi:hypothetical protein